MVAHGTIAFDTLTTSDQVKTGTEKSLDTSYILNGVAKSWINFAGDGTSINDSLGMSSLGDNAAGKYTITMSSAMGNTNYSVSQGIQEAGTANNHATVLRSDVTITTTVFGVATYSSSTYQDVTLVYEKIHGDLA